MTTEIQGSSPRYDPVAAGFQRDIYEIYASLRAEQPVYRDPDRGLWAVSRYDDVQAVLSNWQDFSSHRRDEVPEPAGHLGAQDPPRHDELRRLVVKVFTPRQIASLSPVVEQLSIALLDDLRDADSFDLVSRFASMLPSQVFAHMLGISESERGQFQDLIEDYLRTLTDLAAGLPLDDIPRQEIHARIANLVIQRRSIPQDDLLTQLIEAEVDGQRLTDAEVEGFCFNLILAANETTTNLIANGVALLLTHPEQLALLQTDPELLPAATEEMLRYESPVQALGRTTVRDVRVGQVTIPAEATVSVLYGSANRDPDVFDRPDHFDITRPTQHHLGFGHGIHFCLGSHLARLEARIAFATLLPLLARYELANSALEWKRSAWQRSLAQLILERS